MECSVLHKTAADSERELVQPISFELKAVLLRKLFNRVSFNISWHISEQLLDEILNDEIS